MDSTKTKSEDSAAKSTSKVIKNFHSMPWLKLDCSSLNGKTARDSEKDGKTLSSKKTDEDYFPGTREDKKSKKKKEKKIKSVWTIDDLQDLIYPDNQQASADFIADSKETSKSPPKIPEETETVLVKNTTAASNTIWSTTTSTADKLFPNVQSVVIDRREEEEMLTQAIAESIATVQLEQFNKPSPEKANRWDALYGDYDEDNGWNNVGRNLPTMNSVEDGSDQKKKSCDDNNNSSKPGILKNQIKGLSKISKETEELDFGFKTSIEISTEELESPRSQKSVSFNESIAVEIASTDSSENEESDEVLNHQVKEPIIDKFGRIDGYSERRLFMGKGARMKEQEYIQNKCRDQKLASNSQVTEIIKTQKPDSPFIQQPKDLQTQKLVSKIEEVETTKNIAENFENQKAKEQEYAKNLNINQKLESNSQAAKIIKTQKPILPSSQQQKYSRTEKTVSKIEEVETQKNIAENFQNQKAKEQEYAKNINVNQKLESNSQAAKIIKTQKPIVPSSQQPKYSRPEKTVSKFEKVKTEQTVAIKNIKQTCNSNNKFGNTVKKLNDSVVKSPPDKRLPEPSKNSLVNIKSEPQPLNRSKSRPMTNKAEKVKVTENIKPSYNNTSRNTLNKSRGKPEDMVSSHKQKIVPCYEDKFENGTKISLPDINIQIQDMISRDSGTDDEKRDAVGQCLVPTLVRDDNCVFKCSPTDILYTDSSSTIPNVEFQSAAYQNLLLTGMSFEDQSCNSQNLQHQNPTHDSMLSNSVPIQSQTFNNTHRSQSEFTETGSQAYESYGTGNHVHSANELLMLESMQPKHSNLVQQFGATNFIVEEGNSSGAEYDKRPPRVRTENETELHSTGRAPPGLVRNLQLPPGFSKLQYDQRNTTNNSNRMHDAAVVNQNRKYVEKYEQEKSHDKKYQDNYCDTVSDIYQNSNQQVFYNPQFTDGRQGSEVPENRRVPYPILGATEKPLENQSELQTAANWQYNMNLMNPTQVPLNFIPDYQMLMSQNDLQSNFLSAALFRSSVPPNQGSQPLPGYYSPQHVINLNANNGVQHLRVDNFALRESSPVFGPEVQQSIADYNSNQSLLNQLFANISGSYDQTVTTAQNSWNLEEYNRAGKGRGRLMNQNWSQV